MVREGLLLVHVELGSAAESKIETTTFANSTYRGRSRLLLTRVERGPSEFTPPSVRSIAPAEDEA
jgi:hypothetical protein